MKTALPESALLQRYVDSGDYTDCFSVLVDGDASLASYVEAFYTSWLFRLERWILRWAVNRPSTDAEAAQLGRGEINGFAAWTTEDSADNQLLMCDLHQRTRSWFMTEPAGESATRLYFGSAVVTWRDQGERRLGLLYRSTLGLHVLYSHALLACARSRLQGKAQTPAA